MRLKRYFPPPPVECPYCGNTSVLAVTYGYPSPTLQDAIERHQVEHRGCMMPPEPPTHACQDCHYEWREPRTS